MDMHVNTFAQMQQNCSLVKIEGGAAVVLDTDEGKMLVETLENMTEDNLCNFFGNFTEIMDAFYDGFEGQRRFELRDHVEPQNHTDEMFEGVESYVPGMPYDIYLYETA